MFPERRSYAVCVRAARARAVRLVLAGCASAVACSAALAQSAVWVPSERATSWWVQLRTTGYAFEDATRSGATLDRFGAYQHVRGAVSGLLENRLSVHVSGRVADDLMLVEKVTTRTRLYTGYVELEPDAAVRARVGRQFMHTTATSLALDGATVRVRPDRRVRVSAWAGVSAPPDRGLDVVATDEAGAFGGEVSVRPVRWGRVGASFAYRDRDGRVAERPVAMDVDVAPIARLNVLGRAVYDAELEAWSRAEALARWQPVPRAPTLTFQIVDRRPNVDAASYFSRFLDVEERIRLGRASARYEHRTGFGAEIEYTGTFIDERTATHMSFAALVPIGRIGYSTRFGDSGEETGLFGEIGVRPYRWLRLSGGASRITYALIADASEADERDLTTAFAAARATVRPGLDVRVEVQSTENPTFSEDLRVLAGLDITAGRGTSRFGLDRGGFFR